MNKKLYYILLLSILYSCQSDNKIISNFYHWKQKLDITSKEEDFLKKIGSKKLYLKFFDIDLVAGKPVPISKLNWQNCADSLDVVPCIFIKNRVFKKNLTKNQITSLVVKTLKLISQLDKSIKIFQEIQIDCDWTLKTRNAYFQFLQILKSKIGSKRLTATIRLHQVKYKHKTGIPPVDNGVLMFYNMGNINNPNEPNSILNLKLAKKYLENLNEYPLHLDIALPTFSWILVIRDQKVIKIINKTKGFENQKIHFTEIDLNRYQVKENNYYLGTYLYSGDILKHEFIDYQSLIEASELIKKKIKQEDREILFYHLNEHSQNNFSDEQIKSISRNFI